uniref:Putative secreted protein n=1 Tax=Anopheles darlingi TaxID=43151 RepID=A0A2M4D9X5_ANODA
MNPSFFRCVCALLVWRFSCGFMFLPPPFLLGPIITSNSTMGLGCSLLGNRYVLFGESCQQQISVALISSSVVAVRMQICATIQRCCMFCNMQNTRIKMSPQSPPSKTDAFERSPVIFERSANLSNALLTVRPFSFCVVRFDMGRSINCALYFPRSIFARFCPVRCCCSCAFWAFCVVACLSRVFPG